MHISTTHRPIKYIETYDAADRASSVSYDRIYELRRSHKIIGVRRINGKIAMPVEALEALDVTVDHDHPEINVIDATNLPGDAYYFKTHTDAADACAANNNTMLSWLLAGDIPGAFQPGGPNTSWRVPVDGLWAAGLTVGRNKNTPDLIRVPADSYFATQRNAPMPPLSATLAQMRISMTEPRHTKRLSTTAAAAKWKTMWKERTEREALSNAAPAAPSVELRAPRVETTHSITTSTPTRQALAQTRPAIESDDSLSELKQKLTRVVDDMYSTAIDLAINDNHAEAEWVKLYAQKLRPLAE